MLQLVPAILITPGLEKMNPYARLGMIVGILPSITEKYDETSTGSSGGVKATSTDVTATKAKISGGVALGFTAAAGVDYSLSSKLVVYAEMIFNGITYAPTKGKYKTYTVNGQDALALPSSVTGIRSEWTFEKEYDANAPIPAGSAGKQPKVSANFSNVELNIGIKLKL